MLSKEDFKDYLSQIGNIEVKMRGIYKDCADKTETHSIRKVFLDLVEAEKRHDVMVRGMMDLIE